MEDLGDPISYLVLAKGTRVVSSDGKKLGSVHEVIADETLDIFEGLVIDRSLLPGGHRYVDATQVDEIYERGVVLDLDAAAAEQLPPPAGRE